MGIDIARALAILGMVMAHVQPRGLGDLDDLSAIAYRSVNGRAAILFGLLAGIGVSILDRRLADRRSTVRYMVWRAIVLFPVGLWLQSLDTPVAVILQYYAAFFLVAAAAVHLPDRMLIGGAVGSTVLGPLVILGMAALGVQRPPVPEWSQVDRTLFMVLVAGYYPLVTWTAPLLTGIWVGRRDLRSNRDVGLLAAAGALAVAMGYGVSLLLVNILGEPSSRSDVRNLAVIEPHNQMPLWLVTATGVACVVLALSLFAGRQIPRITEPLAAMGRLAFTVYVLHLLVFDITPGWLGPNESFGAAWGTIIRFALVAILGSWTYRKLVGTGPFEWLLRAPWALA